MKNWILEQKLTAALLLVVTLYNNPLYGSQFVSWTANFVLDSFSRGLAISFSIFFLLTLFDSFRVKNINSSPYFYSPKIILSAFLGFFLTFEHFLLIYVDDDDSEFERFMKHLVHSFRTIIPVLYVVASIYIFMLVILAFGKET
jgi:hypothetical protein